MAGSPNIFKKAYGGGRRRRERLRRLDGRRSLRAGWRGLEHRWLIRRWGHLAMPFGLGAMPGLQSALGGNMQDMGEMFSQQQEDKATEPWKITTTTDGKGEPRTTIDAPHKDVLKLMDMLKYTEQAIQSMSQREQQLQQREEATRKHPLLNVL